MRVPSWRKSAILVLAILSAVALTACADNAGAISSPKPTFTHSAESTSTPTAEPAVNYEIDATDPSAVPQKIVDIINSWEMSGTDGFAAAWKAHVLKTKQAADYSDFLNKYAADQAKPYIKGLFGSHASDAVIQIATSTGDDSFTAQNAENIDLYAHSGLTASEPKYKNYITIDGPPTIEPDGTMKIDFTQHDNLLDSGAEAYVKKENPGKTITDPDATKGEFVIGVQKNGTTDVIDSLAIGPQ